MKSRRQGALLKKWKTGAIDLGIGRLTGASQETTNSQQQQQALPLNAWRDARAEVNKLQGHQTEKLEHLLPARSRRSSTFSNASRTSAIKNQRRRRSWEQVVEGTAGAIQALAALGSMHSGHAWDDDDEDDPENSDENEERILTEAAFGRRPGLASQKAVLFDQGEMNRRHRAMELLGISHTGKRSTWSWIQYKLGIEEARIQIVMKKMEVREEPPRFESLYHLASSRKFELFIATLIMLNCICISWDSYFKHGEERPGILAAADHFFTFIFLSEFCIRILAFSWVWVWSSFMNFFDTFLIWVPGVLMVWVLPALGVGGVGLVQSLGALRIMRLARLCRAIRMIPAFRVLWILVQGVMECSSLLFWTWVIVGMLHFIFGVAVVELVAKTDTFADDEQVQYYFGSLVPAMYTLFQLMTFDAWGSIVRPIIRTSPATFLLFGLWLGIAGIVFFNLMTAIVVQNAFERVKSDAEALEHWNHEKEKNIISGLRKIFDDMDEDNSGNLTRDEFTDVLVDIDFIRKMRSLDIELEELPDVFDILDDGDGVIDAQEFISGLMWMQGNAMNRDIMKATNLLQSNSRKVAETLQDLGYIFFDCLNYQENCWDAIHEDSEAAIRVTGEIITKLNMIGVRNLSLVSTPSLPAVPPPRENRTSGSERPSIWSTRQERSIHAEPEHAQLKPLPYSWIKAQTKRENTKEVQELRRGLSKAREDDQGDGMVIEVLEEYEDIWEKLELQLQKPSALREAALGCRLRSSQLQEVCALPGSLAAQPPKRKRRPRSLKQEDLEQRRSTSDRTSKSKTPDLPHHPHEVAEA